MIDQVEMKEVFENFINENGMFHNFKEYVENQGYCMQDFDMPEE